MSAPDHSVTTPPADRCRIIALINQKGGVGKTTTAVNVGSALAQRGHRVCLLDLDPQAHLTLHLGVEGEQIQATMYDVLVDPDCTAAQAVVHARPNLDAILSEVDLAGAEPELANVPDRQLILKNKFAAIAGQYEFALIDCPPSLGLLTLNALAVAREVIVPMQAHFLALQGVGKLLETVRLVCQSVNSELRVTGIVICMHESQTTLAREVLADLDAFFEASRGEDVPWRDCHVFRPPVRRNIKLAEAPSFGKTILEYEPACPGAADYLEIAKQLLSAAPGSHIRMPSAEQRRYAATTVETKPVEIVTENVPKNASRTRAAAQRNPAPDSEDAPGDDSDPARNQ